MTSQCIWQLCQEVCWEKKKKSGKKRKKKERKEKSSEVYECFYKLLFSLLQISGLSGEALCGWYLDLPFSPRLCREYQAISTDVQSKAVKTNRSRLVGLLTRLFRANHSVCPYISTKQLPFSILLFVHALIKDNSVCKGTFY